MHGGPEIRESGSTQTSATGQELLSLAQLLNILWRRRLLIIVITLLGLAAGVVYGIVTPPLYRSVSTIKPGITGYLANGNPERSWQLKDIVRWYQRGMFGDGLREALGWPEDRLPPLIQADFIPRGVGIQGGNVVTLTLLHTDPEESARILDATVQVFNAYAENSSVGNNVTLAHKSIQSEIDKIASGRDNVSIKKDLLDIEIERAKRDLDAVAVEEKKLDLEAREHQIDQTYREEKAGLIEGDVRDAKAGLGEMDYFLDRMRAKEQHQTDRDSLMSKYPDTDQLPFLWWEMAQDKTAVTARLLMSYLEMQTQMWDEESEVLDLRHTKDSGELKKQGEFLSKRFDLANRKELVTLKVREMEINRDRTLAQELVVIDDEIRILQARLDVLTPLERIGSIETSQRPVRPRKARALGLLTMAAFIGSIMLAFVWEYLSENRRAIFAAERRGA